MGAETEEAPACRQRREDVERSEEELRCVEGDEAAAGRQVDAEVPHQRAFPRRISVEAVEAAGKAEAVVGAAEEAAEALVAASARP